MNKKIKKRLLLIFIFFITLLYVFYYSIEINESFTESIKTRTLKNDGFCVMYNPDYNDWTFDHVILSISDIVALDIAEKSNLRGEDYIIFRNRIKVFIRSNYYDYIKSRWENK